MMKHPKLSFEQKLQNEYEVRRRAWSKYCRDITTGTVPQPDDYSKNYLEPEVEIFINEYYEKFENSFASKTEGS